MTSYEWDNSNYIEGVGYEEDLPECANEKCRYCTQDISNQPNYVGKCRFYDNDEHNWTNECKNYIKP